MKSRTLNLLQISLVLSLTLDTIPASLAAPREATICTWAGKQKKQGFTYEDWSLGNSMHRKFLERYERELSEYIKLDPINSKDVVKRRAEFEENFKQRLSSEDPGFYSQIQEGPEGWYGNDKDKESFRVRYWDYLTHIGWDKTMISVHSDDLKGNISLTKTWSNSGNSEAAYIKTKTIKELQKAIKDLAAYRKEIDTLACGMGAWNTTRIDTIYDKAYSRYSSVIDLQKKNAKDVDGVVAREQEAENDRALKQMNSDPTWRYLVNYFSVLRTVGPPGFNCTWGFRGNFSCSDGRGIYSRGPQW